MFLHGNKVGLQYKEEKHQKRVSYVCIQISIGIKLNIMRDIFMNALKSF